MARTKQTGSRSKDDQQEADSNKHPETIDLASDDDISHEQGSDPDDPQEEDKLVAKPTSLTTWPGYDENNQVHRRMFRELRNERRRKIRAK